MVRFRIRNSLGVLAVVLVMVGAGLAGTAAAASSQSGAAVPLATSFHPIKNSFSNKCLQPRTSSPVPGIPIIQTTCTGSAAQRWQQQRLDTHHYKFVNQSNGLCLDVDDGIANHAPLKQGICRGISDEEFNTNVDLPSVTILESRLDFRDTGVCVDVPSASTEDVEIQMFQCNGSSAQLWIIGFEV